MKKLSENIFNETGYKPLSTDKIYMSKKLNSIRYWFYGIGFFLVILLFLPWTQNINAGGRITTLYQDQRPQQMNTIIAGRIIKWFVREGDFVNKGDTIVQLLDVKDDFLDPKLVERTEEQLVSKRQKIDFYREKILANGSQVIALESMRDFKQSALENKMDQLRRKVISDSAELTAAEIDYGIASEQLVRAKKMYSDGIIALTELERRTALFNKTLASVTEKQQKFQNTKQDIIICRMDMSVVQQEVADKVFKARSEIASSQSEIAATDIEVSKNQNQLANFVIRGSQRWLIAPQSGQITKARKAGINETVKEGEMIVEIVPDKVDHAAELFVKPMDLVLLSIGQEVRLIFDGYPAIVFSGWPQASYGTFSGKVIAIETNLSENGKFRVLVVPVEKEKQWPKDVKVGAGAQGFALLKNVRIWFELWRQINGFPPEYYKIQPTEKNK